MTIDVRDGVVTGVHAAIVRGIKAKRVVPDWKEKISSLFRTRRPYQTEIGWVPQLPEGADLQCSLFHIAGYDEWESTLDLHAGVIREKRATMDLPSMPAVQSEVFALAPPAPPKCPITNPLSDYVMPAVRIKISGGGEAT